MRILRIAILGGFLWFPAVTTLADALPTSQLIIKFKDTHVKNEDIESKAQIKIRSLNTARSGKIQIERPLSGKSHLLATHISDPKELRDLIKQLSQREDVEYVEPNVRRYVQLVPNDPLFDAQKYLSENVTGINAVAAWDVVTGSSANVVAVVDTGVLFDHIDLKDRLLPGYDFVSDDSADPNGQFFTANDGNGRDSDPSDPGDNVKAEQCDSDPEAKSSSWHGTRVVSLIGAVGNDTQGIAGIDWNTQILPVRAIGKCGGRISDINDAIRWSAGLPVPGVASNPQPAKVINLSLGAEGVCQKSEQSAINDALAAGSIVVVAAGNGDGRNGRNALRDSPANCQGVITVGATDLDGALAKFSNYGPKISLSAPGVDILSADNTGSAEPVTSPEGDTHTKVRGTSFSTPLVSGIAALMLAANNALSTQELLGTLRSTAHEFPSSDGQTCTQSLCGPGIVDARNAVQAVVDGNAVPSGEGGNRMLQVLAAATDIAPDETVKGNLKSGFQFDVYRLTLEKDEEFIVATTGDTDTYGYLLDDSGGLLDLNDDETETPSDLNFKITKSLSAGTYFVGVEPFSKNTLGEYELMILANRKSSGGGGVTTHPEIFILLLFFVFRPKLRR